ncbi:hypothetical protein EOL94_01775 [bacterium]|nr:hypothetical protein [bacterium]
METLVFLRNLTVISFIAFFTLTFLLSGKKVKEMVKGINISLPRVSINLRKVGAASLVVVLFAGIILGSAVLSNKMEPTPKNTELTERLENRPDKIKELLNRPIQEVFPNYQPSHLYREHQANKSARAAKSSPTAKSSRSTAYKTKEGMSAPESYRNRIQQPKGVPAQ